MVIGVLFTGILAGLLGTIGALTLGAPLWLAALLYPLVGTIGSVGFISFVLPRKKFSSIESGAQFVISLRQGTGY
jgi:hypothetical protein